MGKVAANAACTIAVIDVPLEEASRFGILNTKADGEIYEFDEKPKHPKSTNASMGIYIFSWKELKKYLVDDESKEDSSHDFGKDVLPAMLNAGEVVLNRAQVGNLAEQLEDNDNNGGFGGTPYVMGEMLVLGVNNHFKANGQGEIVTTQFLRDRGII